ncbi:3-oxoacyl-[acyl-carrier-protein] reductase [Lederbergia ruris]|uniref:3-oxoacyl-[acyl-carrier-protein] reductase n=1 Tax=Lederbergia ruris TaxID=217495 RepID=A0ABQ4KHV8_9BACI|nr:3-oxoacyl-[acyl-carrier-protein] reductase [Lederbergia ruris]GIN57546.1 3-oxoacyl-[acyl-carrier-protein] reductase FabG [Lederbergia ruris]
MKLENKVAIVTGASRGIGKEIALTLAKEGANIVVNYSGNEEKAKETMDEILALGRKAIIYQCNVSDPTSVQSMIKETIQQFDKVDILVNNAGITRDNLLMRMKESEWDDVLDTNLKGVFNCTKSVSRQMMKQRYGRIINISSVVGSSGNPGQANYSAAKAGVIGLTKTTALELAARGITVNVIAPGFITTDMTEKLPEDAKAAMLKQIPLGTFGEPKDIASLTVYLASDDAKYITGQTIHVNGGMYM